MVNMDPFDVELILEIKLESNGYINRQRLRGKIGGKDTSRFQFNDKSSYTIVDG